MERMPQDVRGWREVERELREERLRRLASEFERQVERDERRGLCCAAVCGGTAWAVM